MKVKITENLKRENNKKTENNKSINRKIIFMSVQSFSSKNIQSFVSASQKKRF